ncbi:hypothetical protein [Parvularcula sp. IMCC14364]|uniref:hypothetical protein n=1 Tax=Parvularcula sp. IMCC14364 TaxID=3067902 RepID=UPI0027428261|nr:hypothetical protein [Parvularcula sp. IMCC14364]
MRILPLLLSGTATFLTLSAGTASAQNQGGESLLTPYGQTRSAYAEPYQTNKRDPQGTRIIVNGRIIDAGDASGPAPGGLATSYRAGVSSGNGSTLRSTTLNAVSIGNSVELNGINNSVININQRNFGNQMSVVNAR